MTRVFPLTTIAIAAAVAFSGCDTQVTPQIEIGPSPVIQPPSIAEMSPQSTRHDVILDRHFVSLQFDNTYSRAPGSINTVLIIRRHSITAPNPARDPKLPTRTVAFIDAERKQLLQLLNEVRFTKLVGSYNDDGLADGNNETITLTTTNYGTTDT